MGFAPTVCIILHCRCINPTSVFQASTGVLPPAPLIESSGEENITDKVEAETVGAEAVLTTTKRDNNQSGLASPASLLRALPENNYDEREASRGELEDAILEDLQLARPSPGAGPCQHLSEAGPLVLSSCDTRVKKALKKEKRKKKNHGRKENKKLRKNGRGPGGRGRALLFRRFQERRRRQQRRRSEGKKSSLKTIGAEPDSGNLDDRVKGRKMRRMRRRRGRAKLRRLWLQSQKYQAWRREQSRQQLLGHPAAQLAIQQLWQGLFRQGNHWQQIYQVTNSVTTKNLKVTN
jgi:hypothetical protein